MSLVAYVGGGISSVSTRAGGKQDDTSPVSTTGFSVVENPHALDVVRSTGSGDVPVPLTWTRNPPGTNLVPVSPGSQFWHQPMSARPKATPSMSAQPKATPGAQSPQTSWSGGNVGYQWSSSWSSGNAGSWNEGNAWSSGDAWRSRGQ